MTDNNSHSDMSTSNSIYTRLPTSPSRKNAVITKTKDKAKVKMWISIDRMPGRG